MIKLGFKLICLWVYCSLSAAQTAASDFQFEAPLSEAKDTFQRVELPWSVLSQLQQAQFADLQVLNADNQVVPSRVSTVAVLEESSDERSLNFFRGDEPTQVGLLLQMEATNAAAKLEKLAIADRSYLIIQNSIVEGKAFSIKRIQFSWNNQQLDQWLPKSLQLEASNDLQTWYSLQTSSVPYILKEKDTRLENNVLELAEPSQAKFLRLSGQADFAPILAALNTVIGIAPKQVEPQLSWQTIQLLSSKNPQQYHYTMPPSVSIQQWHMHAPLTGDIFTGELTVALPDERYGAHVYYHSPVSFVDYRLNTDLGELRAAQLLPVTVDWDAKADWRWTFDQPQPMPISKALVDLAWQTLELRFMAQGKGPFRLVYGSSQPVKPINLPVPESDLEHLSFKTVEVGAAKALKPLVNQYAYKQWLPYVLWGLLVLAVLSLLWMARSLWHNLKKATE